MLFIVINQISFWGQLIRDLRAIVSAMDDFYRFVVIRELNNALSVTLCELETKFRIISKHLYAFRNGYLYRKLCLLYPVISLQKFHKFEKLLFFITVFGLII